MLRKHARDRISRVKVFREKSMPLTKRLLNATPRTQFPRLQRIDQYAPPRVRFKQDGAPRGLSQAAPKRRPKMSAAVAATSRLMFNFISCAAQSVPALHFAIIFWLVAQALAGFAAYGMAMYLRPVAMGDPAESVDPGPSTPTSVGRKPKLRMMTADTERCDAGLGPLLLSEPTPLHVSTRATTEDAAQPMRAIGTLSSWYTAVSAPAIAMLSKLRQARARWQAIAELQKLDHRSLQDIGISRARSRA
jgi:uncharacterized protein YjiS (DUF1127 family)